MIFRIMLEISSGPAVLLFARFFRHMLYVALSKYLCSGALGFLFL